MEVVDIILKSFLTACGGGLLTLIVLCIKFTWNKMRRDDLTIKALAHDAFFRQARELIKKGHMTKDDLENLDYLYRGYKAQKLNGTGDEIYQRCKKLDLITEDL